MHRVRPFVAIHTVRPYVVHSVRQYVAIFIVRPNIAIHTCSIQ